MSFRSWNCSNGFLLLVGNMPRSLARLRFVCVFFAHKFVIRFIVYSPLFRIQMTPIVRETSFVFIHFAHHFRWFLVIGLCALPILERFFLIATTFPPPPSIFSLSIFFLFLYKHHVICVWRIHFVCISMIVSHSMCTSTSNDKTEWLMIFHAFSFMISSWMRDMDMIGLPVDSICPLKTLTASAGRFIILRQLNFELSSFFFVFPLCSPFLHVRLRAVWGGRSVCSESLHVFGFCFRSCLLF